MARPTRADLDQALDLLQQHHQDLTAAVSHAAQGNRELSDRLLSDAIEAGAQADALRGDLTWDQVMEQYLFGGEK